MFNPEEHAAFMVRNFYKHFGLSKHSRLPIKTIQKYFREYFKISFNVQPSKDLFDRVVEIIFDAVYNSENDTVKAQEEWAIYHLTSALDKAEYRSNHNRQNEIFFKAMGKT